MFYKRVPRSDTELRRIFDGSMNLQTIAAALFQADCGALRDLTDLGSNTRETDPHLSGILNKRWTAVAGIDGVLKPATGPGIDPEKAKFYASVVKDQLAYIPNLTQVKRDLMWCLWNGRMASENYFYPTPNAPESPYGKIKLVLREIGWIHPRRVALGPDRELRIYDGSYQTTGFSPVGTAVRDFPWKFMSATVRLWDEYPEREGLLRPCVHWSFFKRFSVREQMVLIELFAKPWRWMEIEKDAVVNPEDFDAMDDILENLPGTSWARFPRGAKLATWMPSSKNEQYSDVVDMADKQNSKIVLGQTGTTDAAAMGLGSSQSKVMLSEQLMINVADAMWAAEVFETCVIDAIIAVNFGEAEVTHAPSYRLPVELVGPEQELNIVNLALSMGLRVPVTKAYEKAQLEQPDPQEPYLEMSAGSIDSFGNPIPGKVKVVVPSDVGGGGGGAPPANQAPPANGNEPPSSLPGETPPGVAAEDEPVDPNQVASLEAARKLAGRMNENKIPRCEHGKSNRCRLCGIERVRDYELGDDGSPQWVVAWKAIGDVDAPELPQEEPDPEELPGMPGRPAVQYEGILAAARPGHELALEIRKEDGKYVVYSSDGSKKLGSYETKSEAEARLKQIEEIKHAKQAASREGISRIARALDDGDADRVIAAVRATARGELVALSERVPENVRLAKQPTSINGSPESLVDKFVREVAPITERLGEKLIQGVGGAKTAKQIGRALDKASRDLNLDPLERAIDGYLLHSQMLGVLDHYVERTANVEIAPEKFTYWGDLEPAERRQIALVENRFRINQRSWKLVMLGAEELPDDPIRTNAGFADMGETEAVKFFKSKEVMLKEEFELLDAGAKRRAFTIARLANRSLLELAHAELGRMLAEGFDLRDFKKFANERLVSAGWVPASRSHISTIARTNIQQAHSVGRLREMTKKEVAKDRPNWMIRGVKDARQRPTHGAANGIVLRMSDGFWNRAFPPFGFQCRDRVVSLSDAQVEKRGLTVSSGSEIRDLPDKGFKGSGVRALLNAY